MARTSDKERVKLWQARVRAANEVYRKWSERYECDDLESLYDGTGHWDGPEYQDGKTRYKVNLFWTTIETRLPSMLFYRPRIRVESKPARADDPGSTMDERSRLREDTANHFVADEKVGFEEACFLALLEAHYRFGVVEVGYTNDFVDNPNAGKPMLKENGETVKDYSGKDIYEPNRLPQGPDGQTGEETVYVKRIPAKQFRVSIHGKNALRHNDWVGYYEWVRTEDIKRNPRYSNTAGLKSAGKVKDDISESTSTTDEDMQREGMSKLWKIWDLRTRKRCLFVEGHEKFLLEEPYDFLPFADLKFSHILDEYYPVPPTAAWIDTQKALNWTRNKQLEYMSHNDRRYTYVDGSIDEGELRKLEKGGDGTYAKSNTAEPIHVVPIPSSDRTLANNVQMTKDDFYQVSGTPGETHGVGDAETATQASLIDVNSKIRDSRMRADVAKFLARVAKLVLMTIQKRMVLPMWIKVNVDPMGPAAMEEVARVANTWKQITATELGEDIDYDVTVDVESLTPVTEDLQRNQWMQLMTILSNPGAVMFHLASEDVLRKTLGFFGVKSAKEIASMQQAMMQVMAALTMQGPQGSQPAGQPGAMGPGPTPAPEDTANQLAAQLGG